MTECVAIRVGNRSRRFLTSCSFLAISIGTSGCSEKVTRSSISHERDTQLYTSIDPAKLTRELGMDASLVHYGEGKFESISIGGKQALTMQAFRFYSLDGEPFEGIYPCSKPVDLVEPDELYYVIGTTRLHESGEKWPSEFMIDRGMGERYLKEVATIGFNFDVSFDVLEYGKLAESPAIKRLRD